MPNLNADAILTAIRDVIEDGAGSRRTIDSARFDGNFYASLARDEQSRRALVTTRAETDIVSVELSEHTPKQPCNVYLYRVGVEVSVVRHLNNSHRLIDATRDDTKALSAMDADVLRQALSYPGNLTTDSGGNATGLVSGRLIYESSETGIVEIEDNESGRVITTHMFMADVKVENHPLELFDWADYAYTASTEASFYTGAPVRVRWVDANVLRSDYRPGSSGQYIIENHRTNRLLHSEALDTASVWSANA